MDYYVQSNGSDIPWTKDQLVQIIRDYELHKQLQSTGDYFKAGNPNQGEIASIAGVFWFQMITEELRNLVEFVGLNSDTDDLLPDVNSWSQVSNAVSALIKREVRSALPPDSTLLSRSFSAAALANSDSTSVDNSVFNPNDSAILLSVNQVDYVNRYRVDCRLVRPALKWDFVDKYTAFHAIQIQVGESQTSDQKYGYGRIPGGTFGEFETGIRGDNNIASTDTIPESYLSNVEDIVMSNLSAVEDEGIFGIWAPVPGKANDNLMLIGDHATSKIYVYDILTKERVKDIALETPQNRNPLGIWSDGETIWISDRERDKIFAYDMNGNRVDSEDFNSLGSDGLGWPGGMWSDGTTMWVVDAETKKIYAYRMSDKSRDATKDFNTLDAAGNDNAQGIWSDGETMWVSDLSDGKIYAYNMSDKERNSSKDFDNSIMRAAVTYRLNRSEPLGIWSDGTTMWVTNKYGNKVYAYSLDTKAYIGGGTLNPLVTDLYGTATGNELVLQFRTGFLISTEDLERHYLRIKNSAGRELVLLNLGARDVDAALGDDNSYNKYVIRSSRLNRIFANANEESLRFEFCTHSRQQQFSIDTDALEEFGLEPEELYYKWYRDDVLVLESNKTLTNRELNDKYSVDDSGTSQLSAGDTIHCVIGYGDSDRASNLSIIGNNFSGLSEFIRTDTYKHGDTHSYTFLGKLVITSIGEHPTLNYHGYVGSYLSGVVYGELDLSYSILPADLFDTETTPSERKIHTISSSTTNTGFSLGWESTKPLKSDLSSYWIRVLSDVDSELLVFNMQGNSDEGSSPVVSAGKYEWFNLSVMDQIFSKNEKLTFEFYDKLPAKDVIGRIDIVAKETGTSPNFKIGYDISESESGTIDILYSELPGRLFTDNSTRVVDQIYYDSSEDDGTFTIRVTDGSFKDINDLKEFAIKIYDADANVVLDSFNMGGYGETNNPVIASNLYDFELPKLEDRLNYLEDDSKLRFEIVEVPSYEITIGTISFKAGTRNNKIGYLGTRGSDIGFGFVLNAPKIYSYDTSADSLSVSEYNLIEPAPAEGITIADPYGIWTDGTTTWVSDGTHNKIYAYINTTKARDATKDITLHADNADPAGITANATTMWVADSTDNKLYAYILSTGVTYGNRDATKDITLHADNADPAGIWANTTTMWVADSTDNKLYAYTLTSGARDGDKDITLDTDNVNSEGIWSNGTTMWVVDSADNKLYAYAMSDQSRDSTEDVILDDFDDFDGEARGLTGNGSNLFIVSYFSGNDEYNLPEDLFDGTPNLVTRSLHEFTVSSGTIRMLSSNHSFKASSNLRDYWMTIDTIRAVDDATTQTRSKTINLSGYGSAAQPTINSATYTLDASLSDSFIAVGDTVVLKFVRVIPGEHEKLGKVVVNVQGNTLTVPTDDLQTRVLPASLFSNPVSINARTIGQDDVSADTTFELSWPAASTLRDIVDLDSYWLHIYRERVEEGDTVTTNYSYSSLGGVGDNHAPLLLTDSDSNKLVWYAPNRISSSGLFNLNESGGFLNLNTGDVIKLEFYRHSLGSLKSGEVGGLDITTTYYTSSFNNKIALTYSGNKYYYEHQNRVPNGAIVEFKVIPENYNSVTDDDTDSSHIARLVTKTTEPVLPTPIKLIPESKKEVQRPPGTTTANYNDIQMVLTSIEIKEDNDYLYDPDDLGSYTEVKNELIDLTVHYPGPYFEIGSGVLYVRWYYNYPYIERYFYGTDEETYIKGDLAQVGSGVEISVYETGSTDLLFIYRISNYRSVGSDTSNGWSQGVVIPNLVNGLAYDLIFKLYDAAGNYTVPGKEYKVTSPVVTLLSEPRPPFNIESLVKSNTIELSWINPADADFAAVKIEYDLGIKNGTFTTTTSEWVFTYNAEDKALADSVDDVDSWYIKISSVNDYGVESAAVLAWPQSPGTVPGFNEGSDSLSWGDTDSGGKVQDDGGARILGYDLEYRAARNTNNLAGDWTQINTGSDIIESTAISYALLKSEYSLTSLVVYDFRIRAINRAGKSKYWLLLKDVSIN